MTSGFAGQLQRTKNKPMLKIPLRNTNLVLQFDSIEDRDAVVDVLTPLVQVVTSKGKQPAQSDLFSGPPALVALKKQLLSSDKYAAAPCAVQQIAQSVADVQLLCMNILIEAFHNCSIVYAFDCMAQSVLHAA